MFVNNNDKYYSLTTFVHIYLSKIINKHYWFHMQIQQHPYIKTVTKRWQNKGKTVAKRWQNGGKIAKVSNLYLFLEFESSTTQNDRINCRTDKLNEFLSLRVGRKN